jgi:hypothetical protein
VGKQKITKPVFVGGYVTPQQQAGLRALATLEGTSVNRVLCKLIDNAIAAAISNAHQPMHNGAGEALSDPE